MASAIEKGNPNFYLSGMSAVMTQIEDDLVIPAGPLEIIAGGGLSSKDVERIFALSVRDAHLASLFEILPDFAPWVLRAPEFKKHLAQDSLRVLEGKVVIK
jgi:hypothetical protein